MGCPETPVRNYYYSLRNNPKERESLKSLTEITLWIETSSEFWLGTAEDHERSQYFNPGLPTYKPASPSTKPSYYKYFILCINCYQLLLVANSWIIQRITWHMNVTVLRLEQTPNFVSVMMMDWRCWGRCYCSHGRLSDIARWNQPTISPPSTLPRRLSITGSTA